MKKTAGYIIILHMCTKNHNHMRYGSWDTEWDGIFCHFEPLFALLPPANPENQILKKWKKPLSSSYPCVPKMKIIWCMVLEIWSMTEFFCHFGPLFALFTPLTIQKIKILKKWQKHLEIPLFYISIPKTLIIRYAVPEIWCMTGVVVTFHLGLFFALLPPNNPKN